MTWMRRASRLGRAAAFGAALVGLGLVAAPGASAQTCDSTFSIVPADGSFSYSITPTCDGASSIDVIINTPGGAVVTTGGGAVVTGLGAVGYTRPGHTPYVNGAPDRSPYSNITLFTPAQAAAARAQGNASATANAYSQYGGFSPPASTTSRSQPPATVVTPY